MATVVGVHFRNAGKVYYFDPKDLDIKMMDRVIVDTNRGLEIGTVMTDRREISDDKVNSPLRGVVRLATEDDEERERRNKEKEDEAFATCKKKSEKHGLEMKLVGAEYAFDNSKLLFYFTSDGRVDFRELVKDLASEFRTRIELRQIGVRDETKIMGGIGICGREVCCKAYLADFSPVSIKMAKTQNLSLNPTKISGICGRLMCCLNNEEEAYEHLNATMPRIRDEVVTEDGVHGEVQSINILRQRVRVVFDNNGVREAKEFPVEELKVLGRMKRKPQDNKKDKKDEKDGATKGEKNDKNDKTGKTFDGQQDGGSSDAVANTANDSMKGSSSGADKAGDGARNDGQRENDRDGQNNSVGDNRGNDANSGNRGNTGNRGGDGNGNRGGDGNGNRDNGGNNRNRRNRNNNRNRRNNNNRNKTYAHSNGGYENQNRKPRDNHSGSAAES